jgi:hypothetical protein
MTLPTPLLESSFLDLVGAVEQATELSDQRRRHWVCSLRQIAKWLDRPAAVIPARWHSVRISVAQLHHARVGVTAKTLANHKSNVRAALRWIGEERGVPQQGARLSAEWTSFRDRLDKHLRQRLYSLIRHCSARGINPSSVDDEVFDYYWRYRTGTTGLASNNTEPTWEKFPEGLRRDLDEYFGVLAKPHRSLSGNSIRSLNTGYHLADPNLSCDMFDTEAVRLFIIRKCRSKKIPYIWMRIIAKDFICCTGTRNGFIQLVNFIQHLFCKMDAQFRS